MKKVIVLSVVLLFCAVLSGCGNGENPKKKIIETHVVAPDLDEKDYGKF